MVLDGVIFLISGLVAVTVSAEAIYRGRVLYRPTRSSTERKVQRSRKPVTYWCMITLFGAIGVGCMVIGCWRLIRRD